MMYVSASIHDVAHSDKRLLHTLKSFLHKASRPVRPLHEKLTEARKAKSMSIADVARAMPEVSPAIVGHWFRGLRKPQLDNLRRLAGILEVSAAALVADEPDYAHTAEEKIGLQLMRELSPEMRQAMLAMMKAHTGT